jgi:hypothetical protein
MNNEARIALEVASLQIEVACNDVAGAGRSKRDEDMVAAVQRACNELRGSWLMLTSTERCERAATHSRVSLEDFTKSAFTNGSVVHRALDKSVHALAKAPAEELEPSLLSSVRDACTLLAQRVHGWPVLTVAVRVQLLARELWTARKTGANTATIAAALSRIAHLPTHMQTATSQGGAYGVADDEPLLASCPSAQPRHSIPEPAYTAEGVDADQLLYARPMHRQGTTQSMQDAAFLFNKIAESIPECICACCQELHWRSQMQTCRLTTLSRSPVQSLAAHFKPALPVEQGCKTWIFCKSCARHFQQNKVPPRADANIPWPVPDRPEAFKGLTAVERRLIALHNPMACLIQLPRGGQLQQRGAMVNIPMRMETALGLSILPRTTSESQTLFVAIKRKLEYKSGGRKMLL